MRREFVVERQGKSFCLYAGLLDCAHEKGLVSIHTELIQAPTEGNYRIAICNATAVFEQDGATRTFTGIGDAAPNNVAPAMQTCLLRMAETRAKARALRDGVNIGVAAFEEMGVDEDDHRPAPRPTANSTAVQRNGSDEQDVKAAAEAEAAERAAAKAKKDTEAKQALIEFSERATELGYAGDIKLLARTICKTEKPLTADLRTAINAKSPVWVAAIDEINGDKAPATLDIPPTDEEVATATSEQTMAAIAG